jgi:N-acetylmuramoyl-L-alanine amidase
MKIAYNAGHILATAGKRLPAEFDPNQTREWVLNDRVARAFAEEMAKYDGVELRRMDDPEGIEPIDIDVRVARANEWGADFYLAIHHNAAGVIFDGGGIEVYLDLPGGPSERYARAIYDSMIAATGLVGNRSDPIRTSDEAPLYECTATKMPAVLVECGYMDSTVDAYIILDEEFSRKCGVAIAQAVASVSGLRRVDDSQTFIDVSPNAWYADAVAYVAEAGLMQGVGGGKCEPERPVTRAELAAVLQRLNG